MTKAQLRLLRRCVRQVLFARNDNLHRAKDRDAEEASNGNHLNQQNASSVDERIGQLEREMLLRSERRERRRSGRASLADQGIEEDTNGS